MSPTATATGGTPSATDPATTNNPTASSSAAPPPAAISHEEAQARYASLKTQLNTALAQKRNIDRTLSDLESQIWLFEGSYFTATAASGGNIVKGYDNYLKTTGASGGRSTAAGALQAALAENGEIPPEDRVFSASSLTYQRSLELKAAEEMTKQANAAAAAAAAAAEKETKSKSSKKAKDKSGAAAAAATTPSAGEKEKEKGTGKSGKDKEASKKDKEQETKKEGKEKKDKKRRRED